MGGDLMEVKIFLGENENFHDAEDNLIKAITSKYDVERLPHPDPVIDELTNKFLHEYNKQMYAMVAEILQVIKAEG
jgi:hypothetical protein